MYISQREDLTIKEEIDHIQSHGEEEKEVIEQVDSQPQKQAA